MFNEFEKSETSEEKAKHSNDAIYDVIDDWKLIRMKRKSESPAIKSLLSDLLVALIIIAALFVFFWPAVVDGPSMEPTFLSGDYLIISRASAWRSNFRHGDFVACRIEDNGQNITIIKRLVAMEGDLVEIINGRVYVNGELNYQNDYGVIYAIADRAFTLGAGEFFVVGDNGIESLDSRMFGVLEQRQMVARVLLRVFPFQRFSFF
ncbi:MAG: signal peptidase I [Defluviitaleaceae bacterium]|nr:signal peptidase I [Defluviitaleaceae bacterium]